MRSVLLVTIVLLVAPPVRAADDARAIYERGVAAHRAGKPRDAVTLYERALAMGLNDPAARYNLACALALSGEREKALAAVEEVVARGFDGGDALEKDGDLASLRGDPRFAAAVATARRNKAPCRAAPEFRQLDFWVGTWEVRDPSGQTIGESRVEKLLGDCVLLESWSDRRGREGKSFNLWDAKRKEWRQVWVDDFGSLREYRGAFDGGAMRYRATGVAPDGKPQEIRMTLTPLDGGRVRQTIATSVDGGKTWAAGFEGTYVPRR
jgi:hypothetical protein